MKSNLFLFFLLSLILFSTTTSCKKRQLLMDFKFGLSEEEVKVQAERLVSDKELIMEVKNDDTIYYRNLEIGVSTYKCIIYFNSDRLSSGPLRSYEYTLTTLPYSESGNDLSDISAVNKIEVFKASDFEKLKSYLDKKYGEGISFNEEGENENEVIYKYETEEADLFLNHYIIESDNYNGIEVKVPFYTSASLLVKSKSYDVDFKKEYEKRRKELKPEDVVSIYFDPLYLDKEYDKYGILRDKIILKAKSEYYSTFVIDDDIIECKGILSITDAYEDTLQHALLVYKFNPPLTKKRIVWKRKGDYNTYELGWQEPSFDKFDKIINMIKSDEKLIVRFKATAVVLDNGSVIK